MHKYIVTLIPTRNEHAIDEPCWRVVSFASKRVAERFARTYEWGDHENLTVAVFKRER